MTEITQRRRIESGKRTREKMKIQVMDRGSGGKKAKSGNEEKIEKQDQAIYTENEVEGRKEREKEMKN